MTRGPWAGFARFNNACWDDAGLTGSRLIVALALARFTDASGVAIVGAPALAAKAGVAVKTVFRALEHLAAAGYVERVNRTAKGKKLANSYRLLVPAKPVDKSGDNPVANGGENSLRRVKMSRRTGQNVPSNPAAVTGQNVPTSNKVISISNAAAHLNAQIRRVGEMPD